MKSQTALLRAMFRFACVAAGVAVLAPVLCRAADRLEVVYPRPESAGDRRGDYPRALLALALSKSGRPFHQRPSRNEMMQGRALAELERRGEVDVVWSVTSIEREARLRPIRIPIYKGLIGWRLPLVREETAPRFAAMQSREDLLPLLAGQQHDWPDTAILRANGFQIETGAPYDSLFQMLAEKRFDWFPRSVVEIWDERGTHAGKNLVVAPHIALHYPSACYFFVNRENTELARRIEIGLEAALRDGSFDALFNRYFAAVLQQADLKNRRVIELENPLLPGNTPLSRKALWYRP